MVPTGSWQYNFTSKDDNLCITVKISWSQSVYRGFAVLYAYQCECIIREFHVLAILFLLRCSYLIVV